MQTILDEDVAETTCKRWLFLYHASLDEDGRIPFVKRMHEKG